jgi:carboxymethylenebutenolidase
MHARQGGCNLLGPHKNNFLQAVAPGPRPRRRASWHWLDRRSRCSAARGHAPAGTSTFGGHSGGAGSRTLILALGLLLALWCTTGAASEIEVRELSYERDGVDIPVHVFLPATGEAPYPTVLFIHGRRGWDPEAEQQVRRIAAHGLAVVAPDYHSARFIPTWPMEHDPETEADVEQALNFIKEIEELRSERVCVLGVSRGGYHALLLAAKRPEVACMVSYYGHMVNPNAPEPYQVYRYAPEVDQIDVPVLIVVGDEDFEVRRLGIRRVFYRLLEREVPVDLRVYPHARRAFDFRADQRDEERLATEDAARHAGAFMARVLGD